MCPVKRPSGRQHPHHVATTTREGKKRLKCRLHECPADRHPRAPPNRSATESVLRRTSFNGTSARQTSPPVVHLASRRFRDVVRLHPHGLALGRLHNNRTLSTRGFQMDLSQPPKRCRLRSQRHWSPLDIHPLPRRMGDELQRPRGEVHRLNDAALRGSSTLLWLPQQGQPILRLLSLPTSHVAPIKGSVFWQN